MSDDRFYKIFFAGLGIAILIAMLASIIDDSEVCRQRGGVLVRGVFWFECVRK